MKYKFLKVNKKIEIKVNSGPYQGSYKSKVSEINDNNIKVLTPVDKGEIIPLRRGVLTRIFYTGNSAAYSFVSKVLNREKEPIPILIIEPPEKIERIQRRNYFRLKVKVDIRIREVDEEGEPLQEEYQETNTLDISGGGIRMAVEDYIPQETILEILMDIPEIEDIPLLGKVVNHYNEEDDKSVGIKFIGINSKIRDEIVGWLFDKQRELRKKGLI